MNSLFVIGGTGMLVAGVGQLWQSRAKRRRGAPWLGSAIYAGGFVLYGGLAATGLIFTGKRAGVVLMFGVVGIILTGLIMTLREMRQSRPSS